MHEQDWKILFWYVLVIFLHKMFCFETPGHFAEGAMFSKYYLWWNNLIFVISELMKTCYFSRVKLNLSLTTILRIIFNVKPECEFDIKNGRKKKEYKKSISLFECTYIEKSPSPYFLLLCFTMSINYSTLKESVFSSFYLFYFF